FTTMVQKDMVLYKSAQEMELALANQKGFLTYYFVDGDENWLNALDQYRAVFRETLEKASALPLNYQQKKDVDRIASEYEEYILAKARLIEKYKTNKTKQNLYTLHEKQRDLFFNILEHCRNFSVNQWLVMQETKQINTVRSRNLRMITSVAIFFFMILGTLLFYILYRHILEPIRGLALETGSSLKESSRDEVVSLSLSLKGMMKDFDSTHDELTKSRRNLVQAEKMGMVGEMAAGVAHTIRNPFTSIKMRMFSLSRSLELTEIQNDDLQVISEEISRIDKILQSFLEFARPPKLSLKKCSINTIINSTLTLLEYRLKKYNVEVRYDAQPDLPAVEVDPDRIKEAMVNLITNACEAMETQGRIVVSETWKKSSDKGEYVILTIEDTGPGVPDNIIEKITNPFFTTKEEGSGLGLSIVARIVKEHNGRLMVSSGPERKGTKFIIHLPVTRGENGADTDH
ncbi:MAG: ATP-binding protein, partial [Thermodesulfobacteriota bacterium]|nr:ATP-binding protein [Thermodesulfobacteriota bacterium]